MNDIDIEMRNILTSIITNVSYIQYLIRKKDIVRGKKKEQENKSSRTYYVDADAIAGG